MVWFGREWRFLLLGVWEIWGLFVLLLLVFLIKFKNNLWWEFNILKDEWKFNLIWVVEEFFCWSINLFDGIMKNFVEVW